MLKFEQIQLLCNLPLRFAELFLMLIKASVYQKSCSTYKSLLFYQLCRRWWHQNLSLRQPLVFPVQVYKDYEYPGPAVVTTAGSGYSWSASQRQEGVVRDENGHPVSKVGTINIRKRQNNICISSSFLLRVHYVFSLAAMDYRVAVKSVSKHHDVIYIYKRCERVCTIPPFKYIWLSIEYL